MKIVGSFVITLFLTTQTFAGRICALGRDIIGQPDSYTWHTGGLWCFSTEIPAAQTTWNWGLPAIRYRALGREKLVELRTILWADRYPNDGLLRWDMFDYWIDFWHMDDYLANADPLFSLNVTPNNVDLVQIDEKTVIPSENFSNAGLAGSNNDTYDFRFSLNDLILDRGWWIIGFQSHHSRYEGGMLCMSGSGAPFGLVPYYSMDIPGSYVPRGIFGDQIPPWIYLRNAMQLIVEYPIQCDFNWDGIVDENDLKILQASFGIDNGGDANMDGKTDEKDLGIYHRFTGSPEPDGFWLFLTVLLALMYLNHRIDGWR